MKNCRVNTYLVRCVICLAMAAAIGCEPSTKDSQGESKESSNQEVIADSNSSEKSAAKEHPYFHKTEQAPDAHWSYEGETGPGFWGDLSPSYALAKNGKQQSPINLTLAVAEEAPKLNFDYKPTKVDLVYNGHTIKETEEVGSSLTISGQTFKLLQFHFHAPSEHTMDGQHADMEMHLVHKDEAGTIAVVGILINKGDHNDAFDDVWEYLPTAENKKRVNDKLINTAKMLPADHSYFHYTGSLTTPPCTENVQWYVLETPIALSEDQLSKFTAIVNHNNRPVQPLNGRSLIRTKK